MRSGSADERQADSPSVVTSFVPFSLQADAAPRRQPEALDASLDARARGQQQGSVVPRGIHAGGADLQRRRVRPIERGIVSRSRRDVRSLSWTPRPKVSTHPIDKQRSFVTCTSSVFDLASQEHARRER